MLAPTPPVHRALTQKDVEAQLWAQRDLATAWFQQARQSGDIKGQDYWRARVELLDRVNVDISPDASPEALASALRAVEAILTGRISHDVAWELLEGAQSAREVWVRFDSILAPR